MQLPKPPQLNYRQVITQAVTQLNDVFQAARQRSLIPLSDVERKVAPSVLQLTASPDVGKLLQELQRQDNYTVAHSFAVSILSTLIGQWMNLSEGEIVALAIAGTLHDIGKMKIPVEILNKPDKLTPDEYREMQNHTVYGYQIIKSTQGTTEEQALVALQHHERIDGTGYPMRLAGQEIHYYSKIVGLADVFHAMTSKRVYHDAIPLYQILQELQAGRFGQFDPEITQVFLKRMMESLVGAHVLLTDGRRGEIVLIFSHDPIRPLVRVEGTFVDLSRSPDIAMKQIGNPDNNRH